MLEEGEDRRSSVSCSRRAMLGAVSLFGVPFRETRQLRDELRELSLPAHAHLAEDALQVRVHGVRADL
jgi:hypothetical protein